MPVNIVILAAGQGKRMRSALPKVLHAVGGRSLLARVIDVARQLDPARICIVYGHGGEQVRAAEAAPDLTFARQEPQLGTAHALQQALPHLSDAAATLVLYGDVPLIQPGTLRSLLAARGEGISILTAELSDPTGYGRIVRDATGAVRAIVEERDATPDVRALREINTGMMALPTARLGRWLARIGNDNTQREYYLTDLVALCVAEGVPVAAVRVAHAEETLGANSKADLAVLERACQARNSRALLEQGVTLADPARIDVRGRVICEADVAIDVNCVFEGEVSLASGVTVGAHCVIRDTVIGAGSRIEPFTFIDGARIGERCRVGPYARIRPATELAGNVHIGNFVEVKASDIAAGSKANHLAYVGDTTVGRNVNIGAGTITCNYDGAHKHRTVIEDDVFIGSDTQLVAPVVVRRGATIGAGSTITREAPPEQLTLSRAKQVSIAGWQRPSKKRREST